MSNFSSKPPLQWQDLHVFTEDGSDAAVRLQTAAGENGPQYSLSIGRVYNDRFNGFFRPGPTKPDFDVIKRLFDSADAYALEHKQSHGGGAPRKQEQRGSRDRDWDNGNSGHSNKKRMRA